MNKVKRVKIACLVSTSGAVVVANLMRVKPERKWSLELEVAGSGESHLIDWEDAVDELVSDGAPACAVSIINVVLFQVNKF